MSAEAYARQLRQLLPPGRLFEQLGPVLSRLLLGIADELARVDARGDDLINEWDPSTAVETLPDWERALGLTPASGATVAQRQQAAAAKYVARGGQRLVYFVMVAQRLGFSAMALAPFSPLVHAGAGDAGAIEGALGVPTANHSIIVSVYEPGPIGTAELEVCLDGAWLQPSEIIVPSGIVSLDALSAPATSTGISLRIPPGAVFAADDKWSFEAAPLSVHRWQMRVDLAASTNGADLHTLEARDGDARMGDALNEWIVPELEDVIRPASPAHSRVLFAYSE